MLNIDHDNIIQTQERLLGGKKLTKKTFVLKGTQKCVVKVWQNNVNKIVSDNIRSVVHIQ